MLGNEEPFSYERPFIWQSTDDVEWKGTPGSVEPEKRVSQMKYFSVVEILRHFL
jgi:hypothetical protein